MVKSSLFISVLLFTLHSLAQNTVHMEIKSLPSYHPSGADIYVAGSFNGWNPQDEKYKFSQNGKGKPVLHRREVVLAHSLRGDPDQQRAALAHGAV